MSELPDGWTDDLNVALPPGRTVAEVVEFVLQSALAGVPDAQTEQALVTTVGLPPGDAALVRDRVFGGVVRAATGNAVNQPHPRKDPFAATSYQRALETPALIAKIYPHFVPAAQRRWWEFWKRS